MKFSEKSVIFHDFSRISIDFRRISRIFDDFREFSLISETFSTVKTLPRASKPRETIGNAPEHFPEHSGVMQQPCRARGVTQ